MSAVRPGRATIRPSRAVRLDFDRIALALEASGADDSLEPYERALLRRLPAKVGAVLDVGCGDGALTRHVARRARSVLAVDISPAMIRVARERSAGHANIAYRVDDVATMELPEAAFDVVLSVATLHHLSPIDPVVDRLAAAVRPGGLLIVQDLVDRRGARHLPANALAWIARRLRGGRGARHDAVASLYERHGRTERYLTPAEAARGWTRLLPGSRVSQHLEWRYTVTWRRA
jgi:2-polyprenyl-3-methyl-5-hydroxy-6-metoxy-1,4-benzoquinol methylase